TRINTEFTVKNSVHIGENIQLTYRDNHVAANQAVEPSSLLPLYDIKGNWATFFKNQNEGPGSNPVGARAESKNNIDNNWEIFGNVYADADLLKHFTVRTSFGGRVNNYYAKYYIWGSYQPPFSDVGPDNISTEKAAFQTSWTW